ncbi:MAG: universal stress protein [Candidatus Binatia bacterium]
MFKHILIPTDGSELSEAAVQNGIQLARSLNAKVTGLHVVLPFHVFTTRTEMLEETKGQYERESKIQAEQFLNFIKKTAEKAEVRCETEYATSDHPYETIIKTAENRGCDLIVMASHGRRGVQGVLIGSETQKVLTHTKTPVLVVH